jgi:hypothetical protein
MRVELIYAIKASCPLLTVSTDIEYRLQLLFFPINYALYV